MDELRHLITGYRATQAVHVAAELGIADLLADGPRTSDELAAAASAHPGTLRRLLRALASIGVLRQEDDRRFALTALGERLRSDAPDSLAATATYFGGRSHWHAWGDLLHSVRTGEQAYVHVHGTDPWTHRGRDPEESALFDRVMIELTRGINRAVLDAYDFGRFATVADVGGGRGALLVALLREHGSMQGVLFDQPHVIATAEEGLREAGVADRCRIVGGNFFEEVPPGADAYVLKSVIHDWDDEEAVAILRACRRAVPADGVLVLVERVVAPGDADWETAESDLNMLVATGGLERTLAEYGALLGAAGFELVGASPTGAGFSVIEARPAAAAS